MRLIVASVMLLAASLLASACASSLSPGGAPRGHATSSGPGGTIDPSPTPPRSSYCHGISTKRQASQLTHSGSETVLLLGTVSAKPTTRPRPGPRFQLTSEKIIAGTVGKHPLRNIIGDPVRGHHLFVLIWDGFAWETSGGLDGDFLISGTHAYQRCPNFSDGNKIPVYAKQGVTNFVQLEQLLRRSYR